MPSANGTIEKLRITRRGRFLIVHFPKPQSFLSWAIIGGGRIQGETVAWCEVRNVELPVSMDPKKFLEARFSAEGIQNAVGLMTSRSLDSYVDIEKNLDGISARSIATVGLSNALRVGEPPSQKMGVGTINILCHVSRSLSEEALLEALAVAAEAKTTVILEASCAGILTGEENTVTGTGTDCIVMATPEGHPKLRYAGKHTLIGYLVGSVVMESVRRGVEIWKREQIKKAYHHV